MKCEVGIDINKKKTIIISKKKKNFKIKKLTGFFLTILIIYKVQLYLHKRNVSNRQTAAITRKNKINLTKKKMNAHNIKNAIILQFFFFSSL
ncbi:hypothetical protein RhiirC2_242632 [Rhizophagus irregularis]|uniref:Uncharacterized protein n=1 Tax=Rhizophagus irregularis TaxID=588596 RepID=A0A2N1MGB3_9GLOM|nr:hypothetical protein RhiirC2_242632 [Rhizophagus irregularis]